jgi:hypothetical protein
VVFGNVLICEGPHILTPPRKIQKGENHQISQEQVVCALENKEVAAVASEKDPYMEIF